MIIIFIRKLIEGPPIKKKLEISLHNYSSESRRKTTSNRLNISEGLNMRIKGSTNPIELPNPISSRMTIYVLEKGGIE